MRGKTKTPWLPDQLAMLEHLIRIGTSYEVAAPLVGHSINSCRTKMSELRAPIRRAEQRNGYVARRLSALPPPASIAKRPLAPMLPTRIDDAPHLRTTSTAKLVMDAELRSRIAVQGVTAGLLGDPMPGRSALDKQRAGIVDAPAVTNGRPREFAAPVTLATGPLR